MDGFGTNEDALTRLVATRAEVKLYHHTGSLLKFVGNVVDRADHSYCVITVAFDPTRNLISGIAYFNKTFHHNCCA